MFELRRATAIPLTRRPSSYHSSARARQEMRTRRAPSPSSQPATMTCEPILPDEFRNGADDSRPRSSSEATDGLYNAAAAFADTAGRLVRDGGRLSWAIFGQASRDI